MSELWANTLIGLVSLYFIVWAIAIVVGAFWYTTPWDEDEKRKGALFILVSFIWPFYLAYRFIKEIPKMFKLVLEKRD